MLTTTSPSLTQQLTTVTIITGDMGDMADMVVMEVMGDTEDMVVMGEAIMGDMVSWNKGSLQKTIVTLGGGVKKISLCYTFQKHGLKWLNIAL